MKTHEVERVFSKISSNDPLYISENDFRVIEQMVKEGLIKPDKGGYSMTDYGKVIDVMGYDSHKKKEPMKQITPDSVFSKK